MNTIHGKTAVPLVAGSTASNHYSILRNALAEKRSTCSFRNTSMRNRVFLRCGQCQTKSDDDERGGLGMAEAETAPQTPSVRQRRTTKIVQMPTNNSKAIKPLVNTASASAANATTSRFRFAAARRQNCPITRRQTADSAAHPASPGGPARRSRRMTESKVPRRAAVQPVVVSRKRNTSSRRAVVAAALTNRALTRWRQTARTRAPATDRRTVAFPDGAHR